MLAQLFGINAALLWKLQSRITGSSGPIQHSFTTFCGATGYYYTCCKQVNLLQDCFNSTLDLQMDDDPCHVILLIPVGNPSGVCSPEFDSLLGSHRTGSSSSNKPGISVLEDFANVIQQLFVKIKWLYCGTACIIHKVNRLLLAGEWNQQSD